MDGLGRQVQAANDARVSLGSYRTQFSHLCSLENFSVLVSDPDLLKWVIN